MLGMRMMGITFSDTKNIDAKTQKVLRESGLTELSFQTNLAYTPEVQSSILMENLPMYGGMVLPSIPRGLCGCVYTQLSDVEGETNGLYTYDRQVRKIDPAAMRGIAAEVKQALEKAVENG